MRFFSQNETIILFAQGLVFFALGFAVWLQRRRATRLRLTSSLIWLAAFAFFEALAVWGYVFVPIQESYLRPGLIDALLVLRTVLQTAAFLFLFQFGIRLLRMSAQRRGLLTALSLLVWAGILVGFALVASSAGWSVMEWEDSAEAGARYALLIPAALLSAIGLWRQRETLALAGMPGIRPYAAVAAWVMVFYAVVAGLVVDPAPWAPPGVFGEAGWLTATGFQIQVLRGAAALVLCIAVVKLLDIFALEDTQRIEVLDRARAVAEERARFRRDLHDGTIQSIYASALGLETIAIWARDPTLRGELRGVVDELNAVIAGIREYIRDLAQAPDTAAGIAASLDDLSREFSQESGLLVRFRSHGSAAAGPLPEDAGQHLQQILREALANVARHAGPCAASVELAFAPDEMELVVADNGRGMAAGLVAADTDSHGLRNMRERARRMGGRLTVSSLDPGTRVACAVPLDSDVPAEPEPDDSATVGGVTSA